MKISKIHKFHRMKNSKVRFRDYTFSYLMFRLSLSISKCFYYTFPDELKIYRIFREILGAAASWLADSHSY
jgi:hypothetical protein